MEALALALVTLLSVVGLVLRQRARGASRSLATAGLVATLVGTAVGAAMAALALSGSSVWSSPFAAAVNAAAAAVLLGYVSAIGLYFAAWRSMAADRPS